MQIDTVNAPGAHFRYVMWSVPEYFVEHIATRLDSDRLNESTSYAYVQAIHPFSSLLGGDKDASLATFPIEDSIKKSDGFCKREGLLQRIKDEAYERNANAPSFSIVSFCDCLHCLHRKLINNDWKISLRSQTTRSAYLQVLTPVPTAMLRCMFNGFGNCLIRAKVLT
ncbi:hypothetical protein Tco_0603398, partial [Tanacetum coccineum]